MAMAGRAAMGAAALTGAAVGEREVEGGAAEGVEASAAVAVVVTGLPVVRVAMAKAAAVEMVEQATEWWVLAGCVRAEKSSAVWMAGAGVAAGMVAAGRGWQAARQVPRAVAVAVALRAAASVPCTIGTSGTSGTSRTSSKCICRGRAHPPCNTSHVLV